MNFVKLLLVFSDAAYAEECSKALCRASGFFRPVISESVSEGYDVLISDDSTFCSEYEGRSVLMDCRTPAGDLVSAVCDIIASDGKTVPFCSPKGGKGEFILFTSAGGGQGTSTCAALYSRCLSALEGKKVLYLSFDPFSLPGLFPEDAIFEDEEGKRSGPIASEKAACSPFDRFLCSLFESRASDERLTHLFNQSLISDVYGVRTVNTKGGFNPLALLSAEGSVKLLSFISGLGSFDAVVLDAPCGFCGFRRVSSLCEKKIIVDRSGDKRRSSVLCGLISGAGKPLVFSPEFDEAAASLDIFSQLGTEVKTIAELQ